MDGCGKCGGDNTTCLGCQYRTQPTRMRARAPRASGVRRPFARPVLQFRRLYSTCGFPSTAPPTARALAVT
eukprot:629441-Rhodomonas_salina.1